MQTTVTHFNDTKLKLTNIFHNFTNLPMDIFPFPTVTTVCAYNITGKNRRVVDLFRSCNNYGNKARHNSKSYAPTASTP